MPDQSTQMPTASSDVGNGRADGPQSIFDTPAWQETERRAAECGAYWRKTFQTVTPRLLMALDQTAAAKAKSLSSYRALVHAAVE